MNEELKIIISAATSEAEKNLGEVKKELQGVQAATKKTGETIDITMKSIAKGVGIAIAAITALTAAMTNLGRKAQEVEKGFAKLNTTFQNNGSTVAQASKTYKELFSFLGDHDKAVEAAQSLALITTEEEKLAEWSNILNGAFAEMGDKLPTEGLAEAANETIKAGKVSGQLADALVWAGVSEDGFNAALAQTASLEEREVLLRSTLNALYGNAAAIYKKNNQATIEYNQSQANLNVALAAAAAYTTPLLTSINNLATAFLTNFSPAIEIAALYLTAFIELIADAIQWVGSFFGVVGSSSEGATADIKGYRDAMDAYLNSLRSSFSSNEDSIDANLDKIKELKKQMGFDELNVLGGNAAIASPLGDITSPASDLGITPPNPADYGIGSTLNFDDYKADLEEAKEKLKVILTVVGAIATTLLGWKITEFVKDLKDAKDVLPTISELIDEIGDNDAFKETKKVLEDAKTELTEVESKGDIILGKVKGIGGWMLIIAGALALASGFADAWVNGLDWGNFATTLGGIAALIGGLALAFGWVGAVIGAIIGFVSMLVIGIKDLVENGYSIQGVIAVLVGAMPILIGFLGGWGMIIGAVVAGFTILWNECDGFKQFWINLWNKIKEIAKQGADWFKKNILEPLKQVYLKWLKPIFDKIVEIIKKVIEIIGALFVGLWNLINAKVITPLSNGFKKLWEDIKAFFAPVVTFFGDIFQKAYNKIKEKFAPIKEFFSGLWADIKRIFGNLGTIIGDAISGAVKGAINTVITLIENRINSAVNLINGAITLINKLPGVSVEKLTKLSLPRLATGGIVTGSIIANIGERGREAVLPLENNTGWMDILADRIAARQATPSRIVLNVDGKQLGYATLKSFNNIIEQTGNLPLRFV